MNWDARMINSIAKEELFVPFAKRSQYEQETMKGNRTYLMQFRRDGTWGEYPKGPLQAGGFYALRVPQGEVFSVPFDRRGIFRFKVDSDNPFSMYLYCNYVGVCKSSHYGAPKDWISFLKGAVQLTSSEVTRWSKACQTIQDLLAGESV